MSTETSEKTTPGQLEAGDVAQDIKAGGQVEKPGQSWKAGEVHEIPEKSVQRSSQSSRNFLILWMALSATNGSFSLGELDIVDALRHACSAD